MATGWLSAGLRWAARATSVLSIFVTGLFFFGEGFHPSAIAPKEWIGLMLFPVGVAVGFAIAWRWESLGGAFVLISVSAFYFVYGLLLNHRLNQGLAILLFASPGLLFLASGLLRRAGK